MATLRTFPFELPSGNTVEFREPYTLDRQAVVNMLKPEDRQSVEELLAAYCLTSINGQPFRDPDPRKRTAPWTLKDSQMYTRLFLEMFTIGEGDVTDAKELAKKLLAPASTPTSESAPVQS